MCVLHLDGGVGRGAGGGLEGLVGSMIIEAFIIVVLPTNEREK